ncbi:glycosyltransferase family 4 protein [Microbacterium horticulturae]|uniref:Glycosyltransferase family 4 protein n=1 Tax=Microbacterium horticulturae TaxID=3028316 RepID=A0ABY8C2X1_9MICO|nr:glycosyltransferase family 4 protein [Microbacterium sp. KACC 23027]WEG09193.1 glycosyltransferase family 4 protein [Microbacterium sp. KACC 23027]
MCSDAFAGVERYVSVLAPALVDLGADVTVIGGAEEPMRGALGTRARFIPAPSVRSALRALRSLHAPDIVNTHMSEGDLVGLLYARRGATRLVSTRHFAAPRGGSPAVRTAFRAARRRFAADIAISGFVAGEVRVPSDVILTGVPPAEAADTDRESFVLVAQRLESEKNTALALRAWAASAGPMRGWTLRVAGQGALRGDLERLASDLGVRGSVEFLGYRSDVSELMDAAGVFLASAPLEPYGLSVVEAMAHGLPVIAAGGGGHLETVGAAEHAALFAPGDVQGAADGLTALIDDESARRAYGEELRALQQREFSVERWACQTMDVYRRVLAR